MVEPEQMASVAAADFEGTCSAIGFDRLAGHCGVTIRAGNHAGILDDKRTAVPMVRRLPGRYRTIRRRQNRATLGTSGDRPSSIVEYVSCGLTLSVTNEARVAS